MRGRNWVFLVYLDSCPLFTELNFNERNPRDILLDWLGENYYCGAISPLHDRDIFMEDSTGDNPHKKGDKKKPHFHVCICFSGSKSVEQIKRYVEPLGVAHVMPIIELSSMVRYFAHLDNKDKAQYEQADIKGFGGFDVQKYLISGESEVKIFWDMVEFVYNNQCYDYADFLMKVSRTKYCKQWTALLLSKANFNNSLRQFIRDRQNRLRKDVCIARETVDPDKNRYMDL